MHVEETKLFECLDFQEVFKFSDEVDWESIYAFELGTFKVGHDVETDEFQRVDLQFIDLLHVSAFEQVQRVVYRKTLRKHLDAEVREARHIHFRFIDHRKRFFFECS